MGKLVVTEFVTLDGVIQDPGGAGEFDRGGWAFKFNRGPEGDQFKLDELMAADAQLLGRVTYEGFAAAWPRMTADEFGQKMNAMPKYVVSSTLKHAEWNNTTVVTGELGDEVPAICDRYQGDILIAGSGQLMRSLLALELIDELRLMVFPIVLGAGARLFDDFQQPHSLRLVDVFRAGEVAVMRFEAERSSSGR